MRTHLKFKSDKLPSFGDESEGVNWNAGIHGKRLAEYLTLRLAENGIIADGIAEDWGWHLQVEHQGNFKMFIACACHNSPEHDGHFYVIVEPKTPQIRKWFKTIEVKEPVEKVVTAIHAILSTDPDIRDLAWVEI